MADKFTCKESCRYSELGNEDIHKLYLGVQFGESNTGLLRSEVPSEFFREASLQIEAEAGLKGTVS